MNLKFKTMRGTLPDNSPTEVHAAIVPETDGVLAVQIKLCEDGHAYTALHVPTGCMFAGYGYDSPIDAGNALLNFWKALSLEQRAHLAGNDASVVGAADRSTKIHFRTHFIDNANATIRFREAAR